MQAYFASSRSYSSAPLRNFSTQAAAEASTSATAVDINAAAPLDVDNATPAELHNSDLAKKLRERYPGLKVNRLPKAVFRMDIERDVIPAEEKLINEYGFLKEEVNFIMKYNPKVILLGGVNQDKEGINALQQFFVKEKGFQMEAVRTLVVRYPYILSKSTQEFKNYFDLIRTQGFTDEEAMKALLECPKLISKKDLSKQIKEIQFLFRLYHGITEQEVNTIFRNFPYLYCCEINKIQKFMGEFRKYRMTKEQILNLCQHSGGILASKVSNFVGLFDLLKQQHKIKGEEVVEILDAFPEFVFQNKKDLLRKKIDLIKSNKKSLSDTFIRNLIRRHPDLFLKSWASMEAKVNYFTKTLGHSLQNDKAFPLLLSFNYNQVIRPRCELIKDKVKQFELHEVLPLTDEQFCLAFDIPSEELERKKSERIARDERDKLWNYVPAL